MISTSRQRLIAKYVAVIDSLPVIAYMTNATGKVSYLNAEWHRVTGVSRTHKEPYDHDLATGTPYDLLIHPEDVKRVMALWETFIASGDNDYRDELRLGHADGTYHWVVSQCDPLRDEDGLFGWIGTLTEIDEIRSTIRSLAVSEERFRILSEALPGSTWMANPDGAIVHMIDGLNDIAYSPSEKLGANWASVVHPDDLKRAVDDWTKAVTFETALDSESRVLMADGTYRWQLSRALPQRDQVGNVLRWVGVTVDIDDRVRLEQQIRRFVAEAGQELRTPLTVISGYIDLLSRGDFEDEALRKRMFETLSAETKRMRILVEQLMTLARLDRKPGRESEVVDVAMVVREAFKMLIRQPSSPFSIELPEGLLVLAEPSDCFQAVFNLLENAALYSRESAICVTAARDSECVVLRVKDGGPGIPDAETSRIFERFYRGSHAEGSSGSGLGLAIAAKAALRLGGQLFLEDPRPGMTTFVLSIPALEGFESTQ